MQKADFEFEILLRDDASTDGTTEIVRKYSQKYSSMISPLIYSENQSQKGISPFWDNVKRAKGKYIAICEGDDYWTDPYKLQKQVDFLENNDEYVITYHNSTVVDENGNLIAETKLNNPRDYTAEEMICTDAFILTNTVVFRNINTKSPPSFGPVKNGDTGLWHLLGKYGACKYLNDIKPAAYRVHVGGVWSCIGREKAIDELVKTRIAIYNSLDRVSLYRKKLYDAITSTILYGFRDAVFSGNIVLCGKIFSIMKNHKITMFRVLKLFLSKVFTKIKRVFVKLTG